MSIKKQAYEEAKKEYVLEWWDELSDKVKEYLCIIHYHSEDFASLKEDDIIGIFDEEQKLSPSED